MLSYGPTAATSGCLYVVLPQRPASVAPQSCRPVPGSTGQSLLLPSLCCYASKKRLLLTPCSCYEIYSTNDLHIINCLALVAV